MGGPVGFDSLNLLFPELHAQLNACYENQYTGPDPSFPPGLSVLDECTLEELVSNQCPPRAISATDAKAGKLQREVPLDGKLVNCHSVVIPQ